MLAHSFIAVLLWLVPATATATHSCTQCSSSTCVFTAICPTCTPTEACVALADVPRLALCNCTYNQDCVYFAGVPSCRNQSSSRCTTTTCIMGQTCINTIDDSGVTVAKCIPQGQLTTNPEGMCGKCLLDNEECVYAISHCEPGQLDILGNNCSLTPMCAIATGPRTMRNASCSEKTCTKECFDVFSSTCPECRPRGICSPDPTKTCPCQPSQKCAYLECGSSICSAFCMALATPSVPTGGPCTPSNCPSPMACQAVREGSTVILRCAAQGDWPPCPPCPTGATCVAELYTLNGTTARRTACLPAAVGLSVATSTCHSVLCPSSTTCLNIMEDSGVTAQCSITTGAIPACACAAGQECAYVRTCSLTVCTLSTICRPYSTIACNSTNCPNGFLCRSVRDCPSCSPRGVCVMPNDTRQWQSCSCSGLSQCDYVLHCTGSDCLITPSCTSPNPVSSPPSGVAVSSNCALTCSPGSSCIEVIPSGCLNCPPIVRCVDRSSILSACQCIASESCVYEESCSSAVCVYSPSCISGAVDSTCLTLKSSCSPSMVCVDVRRASKIVGQCVMAVEFTSSWPAPLTCEAGSNCIYERPFACGAPNCSSPVCMNSRDYIDGNSIVRRTLPLPRTCADVQCSPSTYCRNSVAFSCPTCPSTPQCVSKGSAQPCACPSGLGCVFRMCDSFACNDSRYYCTSVTPASAPHRSSLTSPEFIGMVIASCGGGILLILVVILLLRRGRAKTYKDFDSPTGSQTSPKKRSMPPSQPLSKAQMNFQPKGMTAPHDGHDPSMHWIPDTTASQVYYQSEPQPAMQQTIWPTTRQQQWNPHPYSFSMRSALEPTVDQIPVL